MEEGAQEILQLPQHNIGVAMATSGGLVVPNVKDVAGRSVAGIAAELERLRAGAAAGRLSAEDLAGGTITVSNIGGAIACGLQGVVLCCMQPNPSGHSLHTC